MIPEQEVSLGNTHFGYTVLTFNVCGCREIVSMPNGLVTWSHAEGKPAPSEDGKLVTYGDRAGCDTHVAF